MIYCRIIGAFMLLCSGLLASLAANKKLKDSYIQAEETVNFMLHVRSSIECFSMTWEQIISSCKKENMMNIFKETSEFSNFPDFVENLNVYDSKIKEILEDFAENFGKSYTKEQLKQCDYCINQLCERKKELGEEIPKRKKVNSTLCISSSLALIVLLF